MTDVERMLERTIRSMAQTIAIQARTIAIQERAISELRQELKTGQKPYIFNKYGFPVCRECNNGYPFNCICDGRSA